ncbi:hypothetical protein WA026_013325 [Henosepilachna vigintioctopunctata]|uniref:Uncharacterized protein n=1 Tax=Henosepilachna vigintioctopunctata TaxID=420089 RepID=A0AAW1VFY0_9CUCU
MSITHPNNPHSDSCHQTEMVSTNNLNMAMRVQENMNPCASHKSHICNQNVYIQNKCQNETSNYSCNRGSNIYQPLRSLTYHSCASNNKSASPSMTALSPMELDPVQHGKT